MLLKNNCDGSTATYKTEVYFLLNEGFLKIDFRAHHPSMNSYSNKYNDPIYQGDVVEVFLKTSEPNKYYEIEVAPNNTIFLSLITNDGKSFHGDLIKENFITSSSMLKNGVWNVTILIPIDKVYINQNGEIELNAYRIDTDNEKPEKHLFSLSPTKCGSFHKLESFIKIKI